MHKDLSVRCVALLCLWPTLTANRRQLITLRDELDLRRLAQREPRGFRAPRDFKIPHSASLSVGLPGNVRPSWWQAPASLPYETKGCRSLSLERIR
jgi:hypothetical protein